jgi:hypothetical protein
MHTSTYIKAAAGAIAAAGFMSQQVQCPPIAIPLITTAVALAARAGIEFAISVGGEVAKCKHGGCKRDLEAVSGIISARQVFTAPPGVPQFEFDRCATDLARVSLTVTGPIERNGTQNNCTSIKATTIEKGVF